MDSDAVQHLDGIGCPIPIALATLRISLRGRVAIHHHRTPHEACASKFNLLSKVSFSMTSSAASINLTKSYYSIISFRNDGDDEIDENICDQEELNVEAYLV